MAERSSRPLADLSILAAFVAATAALARAFGLPSGDYLRFAPVFALLLLPGWCLAPRLLGPLETGSLLARLPLALLLSYLLYGLLALLCRSLGWSYSAFYVLFAGATAASVMHAVRSGTLGASWGGTLRGWRDNALVPLALVLAAAFFAFSQSDDQGLWDFNVLESLERRSFAPSALDVRPFGLDVPQPRMQANLFHVFFAVLGALSDVSPRALLYYVAPPFLGVFLLLGLALFVASVCGRRTPRAFVLGAVLAPWLLLYRGDSPYWYEFRVLNSPTLDKDFTTFFLLPLLLWVVWRYLQTGRRAWLALLAASLPVAAWSHPVTPVYLCVAATGLAAVLLRRERLARALAVAACGAAGVGLSLACIDPAGTHLWIQRLVELDLASGRRHYWPGHYATPGHEAASSILWTTAGRPLLRPDRVFGSALVGASIGLTPLWVGLFLARRILPRLRSRRPQPGHAAAPATAGHAPLLPSLLLASGTGLAWAATRSLARVDAETGIAVLLAAGLAAGGGVLLAVAAAWLEPAGLPGDAQAPIGAAGESRERPNGLPGLASRADESRALGVQCIYLGLLTLLYVGVAWLLARDLALYRGLERLHWLYFGFFPLVFVPAYAWAFLAAALARVGAGESRPGRGRGLARVLHATPHVLLALLVVDQAAALSTQRTSFARRLGLGVSVVDAKLLHRGSWRWRHGLAERVFATDGGGGAAAALAAPAWLAPGDRVLNVLPFYVGVHWTPFKYPLARSSVYYRELYSEAHALQHRGEEFLEEWRAMNDAVEGRASPRLLHWLERRGVTVILTDNGAFVEKLQAQWPIPFQRLGPNEFRIRPAPSTPP